MLSDRLYFGFVRRSCFLSFPPRPIFLMGKILDGFLVTLKNICPPVSWYPSGIRLLCFPTFWPSSIMPGSPVSSYSTSEVPPVQLAACPIPRGLLISLLVSCLATGNRYTSGKTCPPCLETTLLPVLPIWFSIRYE